jgi:membrane protease YdiL (CAAX protease family)
MGAVVSAREPVAEAEGYWLQSRQPLASLMFVVPLLLVYEIGVVVLGPYAVRNGADAWLRLFLDSLGFGQYFLLPLLTLGILLACHYTTRQPWHVHGSVFYGMAAESVLGAVALRSLLHLQAELMQVTTEPGMQAQPALSGMQWLFEIVRTRVGYVGAGIYEELLFRLILLSLLILVLRAVGLPAWIGTLIAVLASSLLFSAAHYVGGREPLVWFTFLFRFVAGVFFALLFLYRGFGITAAAHAGYNILVGIV